MRKGSKQIDLSSLRALTRDDRMWCGVGVVSKPDGSNDHFEIDSDRDDVLVCVKASPAGVELWARLGSFGGGGQNLGLWRIPPVGSEVVLLYQEGYVEGDVFIIGTLSTGAVPSDVDATTIVLINTKKVTIKSTEDDVAIDATGSGKQVLIQGGDQPIARKTDPVDLGTFIHTPASGAGVTPCVLVWVPPGGDPMSPTSLDGMGADITGQIKDGSSKAKCG